MNAGVHSSLDIRGSTVDSPTVQRCSPKHPWERGAHHGRHPSPTLTVVHPGEGRAGELGAIGVVFKLWGHDTGGALSIVEHPFAVGALVPPHCTPARTSTRSSPRARSAFAPATGRPCSAPAATSPSPAASCAMWNAGKTPARMIEIISPAGFEGFFREVTDLAAAGPPSTSWPRWRPTTGWSSATRWLPDIIARYGLNPPPGP